MYTSFAQRRFIYFAVWIALIFVIVFSFPSADRANPAIKAASTDLVTPEIGSGVAHPALNPTGIEAPHGDFQEPPMNVELTINFPAATVINVPIPTPMTSFNGISMQPDHNTPAKYHTPPDTYLAVGLDRIVEVTNGHVAIYDKSGNLVAGGDSGPGAVDLDDFCGDTSLEAKCYDPKVIYDQYANRFVAVALEGKSFAESKLHLMVSKTGSPGNLSTDWNRFISATGTSLNGTNGWFDYPGLGVSPEAIVITGNIFGDFPLPIFLGTKIRIFDKTEVYSRDDEVTYLDIDNRDPRDFTLQPAHHFGQIQAGTFYLLQRFNEVNLKVWSLTGLPKSPQVNFSLVETPYQGECVFTAPQKGTTKQIDTVCPRMMNAVWRYDSLWGTLTGSNPDDSRTVVHWFEIHTNDSPEQPPTLAQHGIVDGGVSEYTYMPSIGVDECGNAGIIYTQSSTARYPEIRITGRQYGDPLHTMREPLILKTSPGFYDDFSGPDKERWGDYASVAVDPSDGSFWMAQEYVSKTASADGDDGRWGTWIAHLSFECDPAQTPSQEVFLPLTLLNFNALLVFQDDFDGDKGWYKFADSTGAAGLQDGEYRLANLQPHMVLRSLTPVSETSIPGAFSIEVTARRVTGPGAWYGVVFNWLQSDKFYTFVINAQTQSYSLWKLEGTWKEMTNGSSPGINVGEMANLLKVLRQGTSIQAFVNDILLVNINDETYLGGRVGLDLWAGEAPAEARYDDFILRRLP